MMPQTRDKSSKQSQESSHPYLSRSKSRKSRKSVIKTPSFKKQSKSKISSDIMSGAANTLSAQGKYSSTAGIYSLFHDIFRID